MFDARRSRFPASPSVFPFRYSLPHRMDPRTVQFYAGHTGVEICLPISRQLPLTSFTMRRIVAGQRMPVKFSVHARDKHDFVPHDSVFARKLAFNPLDHWTHKETL
jgi:hypothetical protein